MSSASAVQDLQVALPIPSFLFLCASSRFLTVPCVPLVSLFCPASVPLLSLVSLQHEDLKRQLEATPKDADPIDWAHYSKVIRTAGVVDLFKTAHAGLKYPSIDTSASLATISEGEKAMLKLAEDASKEAEVHLANLQAQLKALETAKSVDDLTVRTG